MSNRSRAKMAAYKLNNEKDSMTHTISFTDYPIFFSNNKLQDFLKNCIKILKLYTVNKVHFNTHATDYAGVHTHKRSV